MEKVNFVKLRVKHCNISIEAANICNIFPRPAVSNRLIVVRLKRDFKYRVHIYFEPVPPCTAYQALTYLKSYGKFYGIIPLTVQGVKVSVAIFTDLNLLP